MLNIVVSEIDKYLSEKNDFLVPLLKRGSHNLICANTGVGKTTWAMNLAKTVKNTILLSPTTVIVDQFIQNAKEQGLSVVDKNQIEDWAFGEIEIEGSRIWIGTFSALKHKQPNWDAADYVFFDEIHFLLDLSVFGKETALEVWDIIQKTHKYPNTIFISLTANDELVLPLSGIFNFHKIFIIKSEKWRLAPNKIIIYPTVSGMNNTDFILHYCANYVSPSEKVLCVVKSYKELDQIKEQVSKLPNKVEVISAKDKKTSETYWSICLEGSIPTEIRLVVATTWISLGASILDDSVKHVISTFPNFSLTKQILSRIRTGSVNVAIMQLLNPKVHEAGLEFNNLQDLLMKSKTSRDLFSEVFVTKGENRIWFPLPIISKIYQTEQEQMFADLERLKTHMAENLDCKVEVMWEPLLRLRDQCLTQAQIEQAFKLAKRLHFPVNTLVQFKRALRINTV